MAENNINDENNMSEENKDNTLQDIAKKVAELTEAARNFNDSASETLPLAKILSDAANQAFAQLNVNLAEATETQATETETKTPTETITIAISVKEAIPEQWEILKEMVEAANRFVVLGKRLEMLNEEKVEAV